MDVKPLLSGEKQVYTSLDRMEGSFNKASKSIESAEKSMFSFSKAAVAVTSALSVGAIVHAVDEWGQMAARIKMALKSAEGDIEKYGAIQERFLEISNRNGKAIETVQSLYAGSASSMKELGYNTEQTVDYIESLSSAFTSNATGAQQTESAMNALNRAMVVGTLRGNDWHSVLNATPSVVGDIAKELSRLRGGVAVTENEVKKMAMETGISMQLFSDAMIHAREENNALADSMDNTVADGFTKLTNSAKAYFGELNQSLGVTRSVSAGFAVLSNNFDSVAVGAMGLAAVMTGRLAGAMAVSIQSKLGSVVSARKLVIADAQAAKAEEQLALASLRSSNAAKQRALDEVRLAQMMKASAIGADQVTAAEARLSAARQNASVAVSNYNRALTTHTAAQSASAAAAARASITIGGALRGALGLVGGPVGFAVLAASGLFYFSQKAEEARSNANNLADGVNNLISKFKEMTKVQIGEEIAKANKQIPELQEGVKEAEKSFNDLTAKINHYNQTIKNYGTNTRRGREAAEALKLTLNDQAIAAGELEKAKQRLSQTESLITLGTAKFNGELLTGAELLTKQANSILPNASAALRSYGLDLDNATKSKQKFNAQSLFLDFGGEQGEALKKKIERDLALSKVEGEAKVKLQVSFAAADAGVTDKKAIERLQENAIATFNNNEAKKENVKQTKVSAKTTDEAGEALKRLQAELTRLNQGYAEGSLELAQYDAAQALGAKASPEQIALAKERAKSIWEVQAATKAATKAEEDRKNSQANFTSLQESVSPVTAIDNQFAKQMEQINQYKQLYPQSIAEAEALRSQIEEQYRQKRMDAQWQELSNASLGYNMLTSAVDSFGGNASNVITGLATGTMDAADAARSLGNTMLNSVVNSIVQVGVEMLKNFIIGQTMGSAAAAASAGQAALVATAWAPAAALSSLATLGANAAAANTAIAGTVGMAKGLAVAGARYNGGPVGAGQMYQVGEHGKPEIFKASTGKQYMIPGDNGRVISNKDMQGSGNGITLNIEFNDYSSGKHQFEAQASQNGDTLTVQAFLTDMQEKGPMHRSITQNTTATTRL
ncbi:tape measure protein [Providencia rettgeri]|uniref:tape measure protein n=1 Tax=Providencia rettgeri TaxID=587 RepID=UPI00244BC770|nr:tape measure protein [Providencia rettgeri]MDH2379153.1 tape measure protein [Providencia rettgeri]